MKLQPRHNALTASNAHSTNFSDQNSRRNMAVSTIIPARPELPLPMPPLPSLTSQYPSQEQQPYLDSSIFRSYASPGPIPADDPIRSNPSWVTKTLSRTDQQYRDFGRPGHTLLPEPYGHRAPSSPFTSSSFYRHDFTRESGQSLLLPVRHMTPPSFWPHPMASRPDLSVREPQEQIAHRQDHWPQTCPTPPYWSDDATKALSSYGGPSTPRGSSVYSYSEHSDCNTTITSAKGRRMPSPPDTPPFPARLPDPQGLDLTQTFHHIHNYVPQGAPLPHREATSLSDLDVAVPPEILHEILMNLDYPDLIRFGRTCYRFRQMILNSIPPWKKQAAILAAENDPKNFPKKARGTAVVGTRAKKGTRRKGKAASETLGNWGCSLCFRIFGSDHFEGQSFVEDENAKGKRNKSAEKGTKIDLRLHYAKIVGITEDRLMLVPFRGLAPVYVPAPLPGLEGDDGASEARKTIYERPNPGRHGSDKERYAYEITVPHEAKKPCATSHQSSKPQASQPTVGTIHLPHRGVPYFEQARYFGMNYQVGDIIPLGRFCIPCGAHYDLYRRDDNVRITSKTGHNWWVCDCRHIWEMGTVEHCPACQRTAVLSGRLALH